MSKVEKGREPESTGRRWRQWITEARRAALAAWARTGQPRVLMARALGIGSSAACDLLTRRPDRVSGACVDEVMARLAKR